MNECKHGYHPGWCIDCVRVENHRMKRAIETINKVTKDMLEPIRRRGPVSGVPKDSKSETDDEQARQQCDGMGVSKMSGEET